MNVPHLGFGLGLRGKHHAHIMEHKPAVDWFEIISENYMFTDGAIKRRLEKIREHYPVVMHGVSMSIGTVDALNSDYLKKLKELMDWLQPAWVSDHLCWTGVAHKNTHDLLPVPYTEEALQHIILRLKRVQDVLGRPILMENPSTYLEFKSSHMPEAEFIARMVEGSGCGLLLDVNNVYVSCFNHRLDVKKYIDALPLDAVGQIHLSGHSNKGTHIIDTHDDYVIPPVWEMYKYVIHKGGAKNTMIEWDDKIPDFPILSAELDKARAAAIAPEHYTLPSLAMEYPAQIANEIPPLAMQQETMQSAIIGAEKTLPDWIRDKPNFAPQAQLQVYTNAYRWRLSDIVAEDFEVLRQYLGGDKTDALIRDYVEATPSSVQDAGKYPSGFPAFLAKQLPQEIFAQELAVLENAIVQLAPLPETEALAPEHLAQITPEMFGEMLLFPREALQLFAFATPVNAYYGAVMREEKPLVPAPEKSWLAVYRHEDSMWRLDLEEHEYALLTRLFSGEKIGPALEAMQDKITEENLQDWFGRWLRNGLLANQRLPVQMASK